MGRRLSVEVAPASGAAGPPGSVAGLDFHHRRLLAAFPGKTIIATGGGLALEDAPLDPLDKERTARRVRRMARSLRWCLAGTALRQAQDMAPSPCERCLLGQG